MTWPVGIAWTAWSYMWRVLPVYRSDSGGSLESDLPPPLPVDMALDEVQRPADGFGPLLHRRYSCTIADAEMTPEELMAAVSANPDRVAPWQLARFRKIAGEQGQMRVGDEFLVHMPGPWNGPVRVVESRPDGFRFATLAGHLEAGQIEWRAWDDGQFHFAVESWARAGDRLSWLLHDQLRMAKEVQLYMWTSVLERVPRLAAGRLADGVHVRTWRVPREMFDRG
jgi:Domain of unknown function (DUF1990)